MSRRIGHRAHHPARIHEERTFGQRAADVAASTSGSWRFLGGYLALTVLWMGLNAAGIIRADPYPFIAYTCAVSVLAIAMSSLILLAGNRQAQIDRQHAELSYGHVNEVNAKQDQQMVHLLAILTVLERQHREQSALLQQILTDRTPADG